MLGRESRRSNRPAPWHRRRWGRWTDPQRRSDPPLVPRSPRALMMPPPPRWASDGGTTWDGFRVPSDETEYLVRCLMAEARHASRAALALVQAAPHAPRLPTSPSSHIPLRAAHHSPNALVFPPAVFGCSSSARARTRLPAAGSLVRPASCTATHSFGILALGLSTSPRHRIRTSSQSPLLTRCLNSPP